MTAGEIGILNVGAGDTKLSFDPAKPAERRRAAKVVGDMLKRGYAIFVEVGKDKKGPLYRRAEAFDQETCEYLIVGVPDDTTTPAAKPKLRMTRVPAAKTSAVAVARSAGG